MAKNIKKNTKKAETKDNIRFPLNKKEIILLTGFIIFLFLIILLVTRNETWYSYSLKGMGEIGDAIGGITAPFINLLAAILVYLSFKVQITANKNQQKANKNQYNLLLKDQKILRDQIEESRNDNNIQFIFKLFDDIKKDYEKIGDQMSNLTSHDVFTSIIIQLPELKNIKDKNSAKTEIDNIIGRFQYIIDQYAMLINTLSHLDLNNPQIIKIQLLTSLYYNTYIETYLFDIKEKYNESNFDYESLDILIQSGIKLSDNIEGVNNSIREEDNQEEE